MRSPARRQSCLRHGAGRRCRDVDDGSRGVRQPTRRCKKLPAGLDLGPYEEVLGGLHHVAISVEPQRWHHLRTKLIDAGVELSDHSEVSLYFRDPDGARLELIADPFGEMYGAKVL
jgi:catechol 2,3-dioxygenase-like lactoylglutathione lyase family enzyme